jgi:hypothetical protein
MFTEVFYLVCSIVAIIMGISEATNNFVPETCCFLVIAMSCLAFSKLHQLERKIERMCDADEDTK